MKLRTHPFQENAWYAAALSAEVTRTPLRRLILGDAVVLFRAEAGDPVVLEDRCCHRSAPLSPGRLIGDTIECPYHGLCFDPSGACTHVPGQMDIPANAKVRSFAVAERYGMVWIWGGDKDGADPAKLPDWRWSEDPGWTSRAGSFHIPCHYMLSVDNLMDLSHVGYVHKTTIGSAQDGEEAIVDTFTEAGHVTVRRWTKNRRPPPAYRDKLGMDERVDRWQMIEFRAPCYVRTFKGMGLNVFGATGYHFSSVEADAPSGALTVSRGHTCITPETETSCHYFTVHSHRGELSAERMDGIWKATVETLEQDIDILARTQDNIALNPNADMVFIAVDEGVEKARQLARMAERRE